MRPAVKSAVKATGAVGALAALVPAIAMAGGPAVSGAAVMLAAVLGALCWVLDDPGRSDRLVQVIHALRGAPPNPTVNPVGPPPHPAAPADRPALRLPSPPPPGPSGGGR
ncbi:hypothetical protein [Actinomadura roseirufa]|uniref:hypothetical protein n=1 Tax=Actinomadura roseirufa TaxID=2094049 RepID=UPI0010413CFD|nr:hypothetical protein [Actinomadura roseirufa]